MFVRGQNPKGEEGKKVAPFFLEGFQGGSETSTSSTHKGTGQAQVACWKRASQGDPGAVEPLDTARKEKGRKRSGTLQIRKGKLTSGRIQGKARAQMSGRREGGVKSKRE